MTPNFNAWWDSDELLDNNPYRQDSPVFFAWEGYNAALRDAIVVCAEEAKYDNGQGAAACMLMVQRLLPNE